MALRLAYQISCNIKKPGVTRSSGLCNSSYRRFRSLPPKKQKQSEKLVVPGKQFPQEVRHRSYSQPSPDTTRIYQNYCCSFDNTKRYTSNTSANRDYYEEEDEEDYDSNAYNAATMASSLADQHRRKQARLLPKLQPQKLTPYCDKSIYTSSRIGYDEMEMKSDKLPQQRRLKHEARNKFKQAVKEIAKYSDDNSKKYELEISKPKIEKSGTFDVFQYYTEMYRFKASRVLPHLQPSNLKPYGTMENLLFPVFEKPRKTDIKYPIVDTWVGEKTKKITKKERSDRGGWSQSRDFCTLQSDDENEMCNIQKTDFKSNSCYQVQNMAKLIANHEENNIKESSSDLDTCNRLIAEYKRLNPDYTYKKRDFKSGSKEEQEAVDTALKFAAKYRNRFLNCASSETAKNENKDEGDDTLLSFLNKPVASCDETVEDDPRLHRKKYSFDSIKLPLPDVPVTPIVPRHVPRLNILQTNAFPGEAALSDKIILKHNERLVVPWPSYSDTVKTRTTTKKNLIVYPCDVEPNGLKNTSNEGLKNLEMQKRNFRTTHSRSSLLISNSSCVNDVSFKTTSLSGISRLKKNYDFRTDIVRPSLTRVHCTESPSPTPLLGPERTETPKLKRLSKVKIKEPELICPQSECASRADEGMRIEQKKLPVLKSSTCPCKEPEPLEDCSPLPRLQKRSQPDIKIKKECYNVKCSRADDGLKIKSKTLPKIKVGECPCTEEKEIVDVLPLPRLKPRHVEPPPRVCTTKCQTPRADDGLKVKKKQLPQLEVLHCPCSEQQEMTDVSFQRLKKVHIPEPQKVCIEPCVNAPRSDDKLKVKKKKLPKLKENEDCPCVEVEPMEESPPLKRLKKVRVSEQPNHYKCPKSDCPPRADKDLKVKSKTLPALEIDICPCPEQEESLYEGEPLQRLQKRYQPKDKDRATTCIQKCQARADDGLKIKAKSLPKIELGECPCVNEEVEMKDVPPLVRLKKLQVMQDGSQKICKKDFCNVSRADDGLKIKKKKLPKLKFPNCPCIESEEISDSTPLQRLKKIRIPEPEKICPPKCITPRADENLKLVRKSLPVLKASDCPCVESRTFEDSPPLRKLKKVHVAEPPKICPCIKESCCPPRADKNLKVKQKNLTILKANDCPCIEQEALEEGEPFSRLERRYEPKDNERICPVVRCPPRADDGLKVKSKTLPKIKSKECPCIISPELKEAPPLARLKKWPVKSSVNVCKQKCDTPRADEGLKVHKKTLPKLEVSDCPCEEAIEEMKDVTLPRLKKVEIKEPPKECPLEDCAPRSDNEVGYKVKKKSLATMILKEENNHISLRSYNKKKEEVKSDINISSKRKYNTVSGSSLTAIIRNLTMPKKFSLQRDIVRYYSQKGPLYDKPEGTVMPPLKRLRKRPGYDKEIVKDVRWESIEECKPHPCNVDPPRLDNITDYKLVRKKLPVLIPKPCECFHEVSYEDAPPLRRLVKRFTYKDPDYEAINKCMPPYRPARADDNLKVASKKLPKLDASKNCPCKEVKQNLVDVPQLKRLPKFKKKDIIWKEESDCIKLKCPPRADDSLEVKKKKLPRLKASDCPCIELEIDELNQPIYKRLPRPPFMDHPPWDCGQPCDDRGPHRADVAAGYEVKRKKLPIILKKDYSTICYRNITRMDYSMNDRRSISMTSVNDAKKKEKCKIKSKKKACAKHKAAGCKARARTSCVGPYVVKKCCKQKSPYPSFSEVKDDDPYPPISECPDIQMKVLQPKYPIIPAIALQKAPPPHQGPIDPSLEEECVMKKLALENEGLTKDCQNFDEEVLPLRAKDCLKSEAEEIRLVACAEGITLEEAKRRMDAEKKGGKAAAGAGGKCPVPSKKNICKLKKKKSSMSCNVVEDECKPEKVVEEKSKSFWDCICDFFRAKPDCPAPDDWKKKKLREDAEKAAAAAGVAICDKDVLAKIKEIEEECGKEQEQEEDCEELPKVITDKDCIPETPDPCATKEPPKPPKHTQVDVAKTRCAKDPNAKCPCNHPPPPSKKEKKKKNPCAKIMIKCSEREDQKDAKPKAEACESKKDVCGTKKKTSAAKVTHKKKSSTSSVSAKGKTKVEMKSSKSSFSTKSSKSPPKKAGGCKRKTKKSNACAKKKKKKKKCVVGKKCKTYKSNCPPRARKSCITHPEHRPCCPVEPPYPSFSECHKPFPYFPPNECTLANKKAKIMQVKYQQVVEKAMQTKKKKRKKKCKPKKR